MYERHTSVSDTLTWKLCFTHLFQSAVERCALAHWHLERLMVPQASSRSRALAGHMDAHGVECAACPASFVPCAEGSSPSFRKQSSEISWAHVGSVGYNNSANQTMHMESMYMSAWPRFGNADSQNSDSVTRSLTRSLAHSLTTRSPPAASCETPPGTLAAHRLAWPAPRSPTRPSPDTDRFRTSPVGVSAVGPADVHHAIPVVEVVHRSGKKTDCPVFVSHDWFASSPPG